MPLDVSIQLDPGGSGNLHGLTTLRIVNDGSGTYRRGNYHFTWGLDGGRSGSGTLDYFDRSRGANALVAEVLLLIEEHYRR